MKALTTNQLFTPIQVGPMELKYRVVMGPLTRSRSVQPGNIPGDLMLEYYSQRASDGGLIVSEATSISVAGGGWFAAPGLYSEEQVAGWKRITDAVHQKRGYMFSQLWHTGRAGHVDSTNGATPVSSSVNPEYWEDPTILESTPHGWRQLSPHRALDITEIPGIVEDYRKASEHAKAAGFDGVEGQYAIAAARLRKIFKGTIVAAGGFEPGTAEEVVENGDADLVAFGRHFLANPDLPNRIRLGLLLNPYDRNTFYTFDALGYTDYPFYEQRPESVTSAVC